MRLGQLIAALALSVGLLAPVHAEDATAVVERTATQLIETVQANPDDAVQLVSEIGDVLDPVVDFNGIARGVMGKTHFGNATDAQRTRFAGVFRDSLVDTLSQALTNFDDVEIAVKAGKGDGVKKQSVSVNARKPDGNSVDIVFAMGAQAGEWKVRNLTFDGVNMGLSFRNQFAGAMTNQNGDMDAVIDNWAVLDSDS